MKRFLQEETVAGGAAVAVPRQFGKWTIGGLRVIAKSS